MLYTVESSSLYVYFMTHHFLGKDIYCTLYYLSMGQAHLHCCMVCPIGNSYVHLELIVFCKFESLTV